MSKQELLSVLMHDLAVGASLAVAFLAMKLLNLSQTDAVALFMGLVTFEKGLRTIADTQVPDYVNNPPFSR